MRILTLCLVAVGCVVSVGCASVDTTSEPAIETTFALMPEVRAMNDAMEDHYRNGRFLELSAIYADNAILLGPNGYRVEGREEIDAYWLRSAEGTTDHDWNLTIDSLEGGPDLIVQRGTSTLQYTPVSTQEPRVSIVEFMVVWQRSGEDGPLKIVVDAYWRPAPSTSP